MVGNSQLVKVSPDDISRGLAHLREKDPILANLIDRVGPFSLEPETHLVKSIVRAIIAQQISTGAARSIYKRLISFVCGEDNLLHGLGRLSPDELRSVGVSPQKARYLRDLADKVSTNVVRLDAIPSMSNEEAIQELTQVVGIGRWTVQMLLIFSLGRLDVFPNEDLGVRSAIKRLYRKRTLPKPKQLSKYEKLWQPYASIASWYCW